ncbi:MAG: hypothetical protein V1723_02175 [Candidatus Uhrbacteria bacterium]
MIDSGWYGIEYLPQNRSRVKTGAVGFVFGHQKEGRLKAELPRYEDALRRLGMSEFIHLVVGQLVSRPAAVVVERRDQPDIDTYVVRLADGDGELVRGLLGQPSDTLRVLFDQVAAQRGRPIRVVIM